MRRAERLFDVIQMLRGARRPVRAADLAARLEVSVRTVYRDVVALQGSGVPIEGAPGLGYALAGDFSLPPLMFTPGEIQSIAVALNLLVRTGDRGLQESGERARSKIEAVLPAALRSRTETGSVYVSPAGARVCAAVCMDDMRDAIRTGRKVWIEYADRNGTPTRRTVWPLAIIYYVESTLIAAWCELRCDFRHFRADGIAAVRYTDVPFPADSAGLLERWRSLHVAGSPLRGASLVASARL